MSAPPLFECGGATLAVHKRSILFGMSEPHCETRLELLYFEGCPSYERVWQDLLEVIADGKIDACVRPVRIATSAEAEALGFPGSR